MLNSCLASCNKRKSDLENAERLRLQTEQEQRLLTQAQQNTEATEAEVPHNSSVRLQCLPIKR